MKRWTSGSFAFPIAIGIGLFVFHVVDSKDRQIEVFSVPVETLADRAEAPILDLPADTNREEHRFSEYFSDNSRIGRRGKNKVEVSCFDGGDGMIAEIRFYSRSRTDSGLRSSHLSLTKTL